MEQDWERSPHVVLTQQEIEYLIEPAFPRARVDEVWVLSTGLANTNICFRLHGKREKFVLRVHTRDRAAALRERELMRFLGSKVGPTIPVAPLIYSDPEASRGEQPYSIWGFVEGPLLQDLFGTAPPSELIELAECCGTTLAAIASYRFERCGEFGLELEVVAEYGPPSSFVADYVRQGLFHGRAGERMGGELRDALWQRVESVSPALSVLDHRYSLVHADFKRSNLILSPTSDGRGVAAVLDWEFACAGPALIDVGIFLRAGRQLPPGFIDAFERGYVHGGGWLPEGWFAMARLVDVMSQVTFLNDHRERPRVFAETLEVLRETVQILG